MKAKAKPSKKPVAGSDIVYLRRWCVEQAIRWPLSYGGGPQNWQGAQFPSLASEADIVGRAKKLEAYVLGGEG